MNALGTVVYVTLVATFMQNGEKIFGKVEDNFFGPVVFLLLFVLSATITASLVLGKPLLMYLNGQKNEAVRLFFYTVGWLVLATLILLLVTIQF